MMKLVLLDAVSSWSRWALQSADNSNLHVSVSQSGVSLASACSGKKKQKKTSQFETQRLCKTHGSVFWFFWGFFWFFYPGCFVWALHYKCTQRWPSTLSSSVNKTFVPEKFVCLPVRLIFSLPRVHRPGGNIIEMEGMFCLPV